MNKRLTKYQKELMDDLQRRVAGSPARRNIIIAEHFEYEPTRTLDSLQRKGWLFLMPHSSSMLHPVFGVLKSHWWLTDEAIEHIRI